MTVKLINVWSMGEKCCWAGATILVRGQYQNGRVNEVAAANSMCKCYASLFVKVIWLAAAAVVDVAPFLFCFFFKCSFKQNTKFVHEPQQKYVDKKKAADWVHNNSVWCCFIIKRTKCFGAVRSEGPVCFNQIDIKKNRKKSLRQKKTDLSWTIVVNFESRPVINRNHCFSFFIQ